MGWVMILFLLTAYIPDPLPWVDEIVLGLALMASPKHACIVAIIMVILFFFGLPPIGLIS